MSVFSSKEEVLEACAIACELCDTGQDPRFRSETKEWVHDNSKGHAFSQTYCTATNIRNEYQELLNG